MPQAITATFSIVAYDPATGRIGAATASCVLAVGGRTHRYRTDVGIVVTQSADSPSLAQGVIDLLRQGVGPEDSLQQALAKDEEAAHRQVLCVDRAGRQGVWSGGLCSEICAMARNEHATAAGNCLSSADIPTMMLQAFDAAPTKILSERLLAALRCAADARGDRRGLESAALLSIPQHIQDWRSQVVNLRADLHVDPVGELSRLYDLFRKRFGAQ
jgi:uncharacterized Ntn-hydrolase superfamily protein